MSTVDLLAGTVMRTAASLMNDTARSVYTYPIQIPYLNVALHELQEHFELNNIPVTNLSSAVIAVNAGVTSLLFNTVPGLPNNLIEPQQLWERTRNQDPFIPMTRRNFLPHNLEGVLTSQLIFWVWENQQIKFLPSNANNDIKMDYVKNIFTDAVDENSVLDVVNAQSFLEFRTAGLLAEFIGENPTRAQELNGFAGLAIERATGIGIKGGQAIITRRRPFRAAYKRRGYI